MKIAIIGYGRMGREIEKMALSRNHTIGLVIDMDNIEDLNPGSLEGIDAAIEFSLPKEAFKNISICLRAGVPVVSGTTGWLGNISDAVKICEETGSAFMYASNYSIGVNILFHLSRQLGKIMKDYKDYEVDISEIHHTKKLDAPSGTAISLAGEIIAGHDGYKGWNKADKAEGSEIPIESLREGDVPGTHIVSWKSEIDSLSLKHEAYGREGFAQGAVRAAEFLIGKTGFQTMSDMLGF